MTGGFQHTAYGQRQAQLWILATGVEDKLWSPGGGDLPLPARACFCKWPNVYTRMIYVRKSGPGTRSTRRPAPLGADLRLKLVQSLQEQVLQPRQEIRRSGVRDTPSADLAPGQPGAQSVSPHCFTLLSQGSATHVPPPPNFSMTDYLGSDSRSPVLGPCRSPMLSLGTKCKSVAVPASIKNFKNRTKQTEKDFHNNLKIH